MIGGRCAPRSEDFTSSASVCDLGVVRALEAKNFRRALEDLSRSIMLHESEFHELDEA